MALPRTFFLLAALFVAEYLIFSSQFKQQIEQNYPLAYDQSSYYLQTYQLLNAFYSQGWSVLFSRSGATGATFPMQAMLLALINGVSRFSFLSLNLVYFLSLQAVLFFTVENKTSDRFQAWISVALVLALSTIFNVAGGLYDFRIDFSAMCLYGIFVCAILNTKTFSDFRWSIAVGAIGALIVSMRFITIAYVGPVLLLLFVALVIRSWLSPNVRPRQVRNSFLSGIVTLMIAGPFLWSAKELLYEYYGIGHALGSEGAVRAAEFGVNSTLDYIWFYPKSLFQDHLGLPFGWMAGIFMVVGAIVVGTRREYFHFRRSSFDFLVIILSIFVPIIILTIDVSKSPVVGGVVCIPVILLLVLLSGPRWPLAIAWPCAIAASVFGFFVFVSNANLRQHYLSDADLVTVNQINETIAQYVIDTELAVPKLALDRLDDYLNAVTISLANFKNFRRDMPAFPRIETTLATSVSGVDAETALNAVRASDVFVLTDPEKGRGGIYPFDQAMKEVWPRLAGFSEDNLFKLADVKIRGIPYRVFVGSPIRIDGLSADWATADGMTVMIDRKFLKQAPFIELDGRSFTAWLGSGLTITTNSSGKLPVRYHEENGKYRIIVDARNASGGDGLASIKLEFDRYFVPRALGINEDTRKLVIGSPTERRLHKTDPFFLK